MVDFIVNVYGITEVGTKVKIGTANQAVDDAYPVGGKIFYIDSAVDNSYKFFDIYGDEITDIAVGDSPYAYKVINKSVDKDKFYVFNPSEKRYVRWTYKTTDWVYTDFIGQSLVKDPIGFGRQNTIAVVGADWNSAYVTNDSGNDNSNVPTVWYALKKMRDNKENGCDDWYLPSRDELETLATARDRYNLPLSELFSQRKVLSSTDGSASTVKRWAFSQMDATTKNDYITTSFGVRSF